jgi:hypothetical protein
LLCIVAFHCLLLLPFPNSSLLSVVVIHIDTSLTSYRSLVLHCYALLLVPLSLRFCFFNLVLTPSLLLCRQGKENRKLKFQTQISLRWVFSMINHICYNLFKATKKCLMQVRKHFSNILWIRLNIFLFHWTSCKNMVFVSVFKIFLFWCFFHCVCMFICVLWTCMCLDFFVAHVL